MVKTRMFRSKKTELPDTPQPYPVGTFVKTEKGYFYIKSRTARYRIITKRLLNSWSPHRVVETTEAALARHKVVAKMKFRNGSLLHSFADGKIYLVVDGKRCHVQSADALAMLGAVGENIPSVTPNELQLQPEGEPIV